MIALAVVAAALAVGAGPAEEPCEGAGEAPIVKRDRARAKARAVDEALAHCAEAVALRLLEDGRAGSGLSVDDRTRAVAVLRPQLAQEPGRLFERYRVTADRAESGWVRVELEGRARLDPILQLARASALNLSRGHAVVGVLVYESTARGERRELYGESLVGGQLARLLHDRGYEVRPVPFDPGAEARLLDDPRALGRRARQAHVELLIAGEVLVTEETGKTLARTRDVSIDALFQVIEASSGKLRGRLPLTAQAEGSAPLRALRQALDAGLLARLFDGVAPYLAMDAVRPRLEPRPIALTFRGFDRFRGGARAVMEMLKLVPGASAIDERDYYEDTLVVELTWGGTMEELEIELTSELSRHRESAGFRVVERGADRLVLVR